MTDIIAGRQNSSSVNPHQPRAKTIAVWQSDGMNFGGRLRDTRKARGLRGVQLAAKSGVDGTTISRYERGERLSPEADKVTKLAKALEVNERWLLTGEGPKEPGPITIEPPIGRSALEAVLFSYDWPDVPIELVDDISEALRTEAETNGGRTRSASAWRLRIGQVLRERAAPKKRISGPKMRALTGGSR